MFSNKDRINLMSTLKIFTTYKLWVVFYSEEILGLQAREAAFQATLREQLWGGKGRSQVI